MKVLLIGEAPGKRGDPEKVLDYQIFAELEADRVNLFADRKLIDDGIKVKWPTAAARKNADAMIPSIGYRYDRVVFVGKRVARAFGFSERYFEWKWFYERGLPPCVVFPHPSGLNRWWNDEKNRRHAESFVLERLS